MSAILALVLAQGVPIVTPLVGPPKITWLGPPGDANGSGYDASLEPLRLGLFDETPLTGDPSCRLTPAPTYYATTFRLVPQLTLAGFSRVGCAMDGAASGGLVYTVPIRKNIDLDLSAGAILAPHGGPNGTSISTTHVRADIVFKRDEGRTFYLGLRKRGIAFGGVY